MKILWRKKQLLVWFDSPPSSLSDSFNSVSVVFSLHRFSSDTADVFISVSVSLGTTGHLSLTLLSPAFRPTVSSALASLSSSGKCLRSNVAVVIRRRSAGVDPFDVNGCSLERRGESGGFRGETAAGSSVKVMWTDDFIYSHSRPTRTDPPEVTWGFLQSSSERFALKTCESTFLSASVCAGAADLNTEVISAKCTNLMFYKSSASACSDFIINYVN